MIVADASAAVSAVLRDGAARRLFGSDAVCVPHLVDSEVANALRGLARRGVLSDDAARILLVRWAELGVERFAVTGLLPRIWELRENVTAYDATYVALAEALGVALVSADARLARAVGPRCPITVLPA